MMSSKILLHREKIAWQGKHSGYDQLGNYLHELRPGEFLDVFVDRSRTSHIRATDILFFPFYYIWKKITSGYDEALSKADLEVFWKSLRYQYRLIHVMYVERNFGYIDKWKPRVTHRIVGTVHQPPHQWDLNQRDPKILSDFDAMIVVSRESAAFFETYLPGRVHFIPHGVDTDFFKPGAQKTHHLKDENSLCLFIGTWLRDIKTLSAIIDKVIGKNPRIHFAMVVPPRDMHDRNSLLHHMARHRQVSWHIDISDDALRALYQRASMLVLPLLNATANNALVEAISSGLPVVSNNVGGIPDYTDKSFADLMPIGDIDGFVESILKLVDDHDERQKRSIAARNFALKHLSWSSVAQQTIEFYDRICKNTT